MNHDEATKTFAGSPTLAVRQWQQEVRTRTSQVRANFSQCMSGGLGFRDAYRHGQLSPGDPWPRIRHNA